MQSGENFEQAGKILCQTIPCQNLCCKIWLQKCIAAKSIKAVTSATLV